MRKNMNDNELLNYKIIGKLNAGLSTASDYGQAVRTGLKIIADNKIADCAVLWQSDPEEDGVIYPLYWICPIELATKKHYSGEGVVGRVFHDQRSEYIPDFRKTPDKSIEFDFEGLDVAGLVCIPFSVGDKSIGCLQFLRLNDSPVFSEDDINSCEIFSVMLQMLIKEYKLFPIRKKKQDVLISVRDVCKTYNVGDFTSQVLKGVNFDVYEGEFLCFLGESGCGKSTMLNIIGGLLDFEKGSLKFEGTELRGASRKHLTEYRKNNIGFIFQSYNLMPNLNAKDNLSLIADLVKDPMDPMEALKLVNMDSKAHSYPSRLSGGQQQRIAIARALVKKPKLILADEPTAALDYTTSIEVLSVLEKVIRSGTTIVMVTHNEEITKMADRVIRFRNGKTYEIAVNPNPLKAEELVW